MKKKVYDENVKLLLKSVIDKFDEEDRAVRERQLRQWKRLKMIWEGFQNVYYSEVAHDWRVWDYQSTDGGGDNQAYYDKPINVFRAYLESIIAALSVAVPPVKCYPDDADNPLDLSTAKAGDKIGELVYRHNDVALVWLHGLFIRCTEGLVGFYNYEDCSKEYGTYEDKKYESIEEEQESLICPLCNAELISKSLSNRERDEFDPGDDDVDIQNLLGQQDICPQCLELVDPEYQKNKLIITRLVGVTREAKSRVKIEAYGGLNIKVPNYARTQADTPYLILSKEINYTKAIEKYPKLYSKIQSDTKISSGVSDPYEQWARLNPQYFGEYPNNVVTERHCWLREWAFNCLTEEESKELKRLFPFGVCVALINDEVADIYIEKLDDHWTLNYDPMSDYLHNEPTGMQLVSVQEITNDLISLVLQTIEHGIPQTFVDPAVVNLNQYKQLEVTPGALVGTKPGYGKKISDGFYEVRTATLSQETLPFAAKIQDLGQLASGALPSLFGGALQGTDTASEYSMSRQQALQRQGNVFKMYVITWRNMFGKVVPMFMNLMKDDERFVEKDDNDNFLNVFIRKSELEGKIGRIEIEANEALPMSWTQKKDFLEKLMLSNNPEILAMLGSPENLPVIREAIGLTDFYIPGEDDRQKQYEEIKLLLNSEPISDVIPSVEVDPDIDNHQVQFETCRIWLISDAGRLAKVENPEGYANVLLHAKMHLMFLQNLMATSAGNGANQKKSNENETKEAPITGESDVSIN